MKDISKVRPTKEKVIKFHSEHKELPKQNLFDYMNENQPSSIQWNCKDVMIGVVGVERKIGTTTAAFHLVDNLSQTGAKVIYTEANRNKHLSKIAQDYNFTKEEGYYCQNNTNYFENADIQLGANFIVVDDGYVNQENAGRLKKFNELVVVSGVKPYELGSLKESLKLLQNCKINLAFNSVPEGQQDIIREEYTTKDIKVYFMKYAPDLMCCDKNLDEIMEQLVNLYKDEGKENKEYQSVNEFKESV